LSHVAGATGSASLTLLLQIVAAQG
jgi:hypothetical protein